MLENLLEIIGFALIVAFCIVVWWPSALLVGGIGLIAASVVGSRS